MYLSIPTLSTSPSRISLNSSNPWWTVCMQNVCIAWQRKIEFDPLLILCAFCSYPLHYRLCSGRIRKIGSKISYSIAVSSSRKKQLLFGIGWCLTLHDRIARDPRFERLPCSHKGTYADDCLVQRVMQHKCYIVATCDKDLKRRIRKIPGIPIMYISGRRYAIERLPELGTNTF